MFSISKKNLLVGSVAALALPGALAGAASTLTLADGVTADGAAGSIAIMDPEKIANVDDVSLYTLSLGNQDGLSSAQITYKGGIVVQLFPTDTAINNADYTGIITYSTAQDANPASQIESVTIGGVEVTQVKEPGLTFVGEQSVSSSFNPDTFLGAFAGKTQEEFNAALQAGELEVVVRSFAYPDGELTGTLTGSLPPNAASGMAVFAGIVAAGLAMVL